MATTDRQGPCIADIPIDLQASRLMLRSQNVFSRFPSTLHGTGFQVLPQDLLKLHL